MSRVKDKLDELALTLACPTCRVSAGAACLVMSRCGVRAPRPHRSRIARAVAVAMEARA